MTTYVLGQIDIFDREQYARYEAGFMDILLRYDGEILSVDEAPEVLEGEWRATRTVLLSFPNRAQASAWYHSEEYQTLAEHRRAASSGSVLIMQAFGE